MHKQITSNTISANSYPSSARKPVRRSVSKEVWKQDEREKKANEPQQQTRKYTKNRLLLTIYSISTVAITDINRAQEVEIQTHIHTVLWTHNANQGQKRENLKTLALIDIGQNWMCSNL